MENENAIFRRNIERLSARHSIREVFIKLRDCQRPVRRADCTDDGNSNKISKILPQNIIPVFAEVNWKQTFKISTDLMLQLYFNTASKQK